MRALESRSCAFRLSDVRFDGAEVKNSIAVFFGAVANAQKCNMLVQSLLGAA